METLEETMSKAAWILLFRLPLPPQQAEVFFFYHHNNTVKSCLILDIEILKSARKVKLAESQQKSLRNPLGRYSLGDQPSHKVQPSVCFSPRVGRDCCCFVWARDEIMTLLVFRGHAVWNMREQQVRDLCLTPAMCTWALASSCLNTYIALCLCVLLCPCFLYLQSIYGSIRASFKCTYSTTTVTAIAIFSIFCMSDNTKYIHHFI